MYKEITGKMETHVSHDLSFRGLLRREYAVKDYTVTCPHSAVVELRNH